MSAKNARACALRSCSCLFSLSFCHPGFGRQSADVPVLSLSWKTLFFPNPDGLIRSLLGDGRLCPLLSNLDQLFLHVG